MSNKNVSRDEREYLRYLRDVHFRNQNGRCYYCDVVMTPADAPQPLPSTTVTIEHLKGREIGGGSNYLNTAASCLGCNQQRAIQHPVGKHTVPKIRLVTKQIVAEPVTREWTYGYTVPSDPKTLCLFNSNQQWGEIEDELKRLEGQPVTLKHKLALTCKKLI